MELAIPLVALGGMYIISTKNKQMNKQKKKVSFPLEKENFTNMGKPNNYLPNVNIPTINYPVTNEKELADTVQHYPNPNVATDKYFDQNLYEEKQRSGERVGSIVQDVYSLSGNYMNSQEFKHNNMVPFYGAKMKGKLFDDNIAESVLDNMAGTGSQIIKKIEQAPLFKPQENINWTYGAPVMTEFYQSRENPANRNNMVKPFESQQVGPGLNKGFSAEGSGGFNSGMDARDHWLPKTVDELRVVTNPKEEYSLNNLEGPAQSVIKNVGKIGLVEKYSPDTFYIQSQDRWLTTTGEQKEGRMIAQEIQKTSNRNDVTQHYNGTPGSNLKTASYTSSVYQEPKRSVLSLVDVPASNACGKGPIHDEHNQKSYSNIVNNRATTCQQDTIRSGFSRAIGAAIAPLMDILRPSRKEEYSNNIRVYGNINGEIPSNYIINKGDVPITTLKETTIYSPHGNVGNQIEGAYSISEQQTIQNQRDSTNFSTYGGAISNVGNRQYDAEYRQNNNIFKEKTMVSRTNQGNTSLFSGEINATFYKQDADRENNRLWAPEATNYAGPSIETYGSINMPQYYNECQGCDRIEPALLNAFKSNPYTHSLTNAV